MRLWSNTQGGDDGSVHAIGNGEMLVYGKGPNILHIYGPPYSAPPPLDMYIKDAPPSVSVESSRERDTAIWTHDVFENGVKTITMKDYILPDRNVFVREFDSNGSLVFRIKPNPAINAFDMGSYFRKFGYDEKTILLSIPKGTLFFCRDSITYETDMFILATGCAGLHMENDGYISLMIGKGKGRVMFAGGKSLPEAAADAEDYLSTPDADFENASRKYWHDFSSRRYDFAKMIPDNHPLKERLLYAIDSISILIKSQQSSSGGVMAGHIYNMAYIRDMSGVMRGLLALGYISEARAILEFWMHKYEIFGCLLNADAMGNDATRLRFNNDEVEIPAYIVHNCFVFFEKTRDEYFLKKVFPMMQWAFEIQLSHVRNGMTEFNGDETYMAGGTLKISIFQGSAESTLLFLTSGEKLLAWARRNGLWNEYKLENYGKILKEVRDNYKKNFVENGILYANNKTRKDVAGRPRFRFMYCFGHDAAKQTTPVMAWLEINEKGQYLCPDCRNKELQNKGMDENKRYIMNSVNLVPLYINADMFSKEEIMKIVEPGIDLFERTGAVPSNLEGTRSLGYDYGLMLYNMIKLGHPSKDKMVKKMLDILDPAGGWVEYYDNDVPFNCRCRAWESGINIESVVEYISNSDLSA